MAAEIGALIRSAERARDESVRLRERLRLARMQLTDLSDRWVVLTAQLRCVREESCCQRALWDERNAGTVATR